MLACGMLILELAQTNANNKCYPLAKLYFFVVLGATESENNSLIRPTFLFSVGFSSHNIF